MEYFFALKCTSDIFLLSDISYFKKREVTREQIYVEIKEFSDKRFIFWASTYFFYLFSTATAQTFVYNIHLIVYVCYEKVVTGKDNVSFPEHQHQMKETTALLKALLPV